MKPWIALLFCIMLSACASPPVVPHTEHLLHDHLFPPAAERINADDVFALSAEMKRFLAVDIAAQLHAKGREKGLFDALYRKGQLIAMQNSTTRRDTDLYAAKLDRIKSSRSQ